MQRLQSVSSDLDETSILESIHEVDANQWNNLVAQSEFGSLFHRYEWLAAVEEGFDYEPRHVLVTKQSNPVAIFPNFVSAVRLPNAVADTVASWLDISVMTSGKPLFGGPVIGTDERENIERVLDAVETTADSGLLFHEISTDNLGLIRYGKQLQLRGYELRPNFALIVLDLRKGWETVLANMDKERRKAIRKAHEQEYDVEISPIGDEMDRTYEMYIQNIERVDGTAVPASFFESVRDNLDDRVRVFTAYVDGEEVGRYVYLLDSERSVLHHWLSAIPDSACYEYYPSELLHARGIQWGIDSGFDSYDFGPVGSSFDNTVFRFKAKYGGQAMPLLRWEKGGNRVVWPLYRFARSKYLERIG